MKSFRHVPLLCATLFGACIASVVVTSNQGSCRVCTVVKTLPFGDKVGHVVLYGLLTFLFGVALGKQRRHVCGVTMYTTSLILMVLITLEEASQIFFTTRTADVIDLLASFVGVVVGDYGAFAMNSVRKRPEDHG